MDAVVAGIGRAAAAEADDGGDDRARACCRSCSASGSGMDITQPIATPTFGGMISSTIYVLFLIPCLFAIGEDIRRWRPAWFGGRVIATRAAGEHS